MRIVSGIFKNRPLKVPTGKSTRPSSAKLRSAIFDSCQGEIEGLDVLDIFAGSGAIGFEALSRGAQSVSFIENNRKAIDCIRENAKNLGVEKRISILQGDFSKELKRLEKEESSFSFIYADPPYQQKIDWQGSQLLYSECVLQIMDRSDILQKGSKLFIEEGSQESLQVDKLLNLHFHKQKKYGAGTLWRFSRT